MSEPQVTITAEQLSAMSERLVSRFLADEIPHDIKTAVSKSVAERLTASDEWQKLAQAITDKFAARRDEIAQRICTGMIETMSRGIVSACEESIRELSKRMSSLRIY